MAVQDRVMVSLTLMLVIATLSDGIKSVRFIFLYNVYTTICSHWISQPCFFHVSFDEYLFSYINVISYLL